MDDAIDQLRGEAGTEPAEAIDEARKDVKKIRSALRLVRDEIGDDVWRRENDHYRDVARKLSSVPRRRNPGGGPRRARRAVRAGLRASDFETLHDAARDENRAAHDDGTIERTMAGAAAELSLAGRASTTCRSTATAGT